MRCHRCQAENREGRRFCADCGEPLSPACPSCGFSNEPHEKFCGGCGQPLQSSKSAAPKFHSPESYTPKHLAEKILLSKSALEGERKQVTVLFADLKGSMELLADRDPEEARKLLDPVLERMMEAVHHYEGTVNQVMGDGIMALFGAPVAHEDHAVRACYAALRMQRRVTLYADELQRGGGTPVQIRVGLNSGEVVVRAIGSDLHMDYTAVGQTTHLAARMEQMARPGSALVTGDTLAQAEGYVQVRPLGAVPVKGLETPTPVYELIGSGPTRSRLQASAARGLTRFVGRERELEQVAQALERAAAGHGQAVAVVGEAGVGKSRLLWEFARSHRTHGWLGLESGAVSYGQATPYLPVIDLLKAYCRIQERDDPREIRERVAGKLLMLDRALEPLLTPLLALLDVPVDDAVWHALDPPQRRQRTLEAVKRLLLRESQVQPLLVVFEDLHWIDSETQALLDSLIESLPTARVLLLVNYRPEYEHTWGRKTYYTQLRLDSLPPQSAEELLAALLGEDRTLEPLKRVLIARTEGNPFFLEESVRTLVETQVLVGERGAYRMTKALAGVQVPATVQAILAARIDRLSPEDKRLLQTASVIGKEVPFALLQIIAELPEDALRRGLAHLQAAEFLYETSLFPDLDYTFKHVLTHEVAYGSLLQERRRSLHARIVEVIEGLYADRLIEQLELLAHHAQRGEVWEKCVKYQHQAGAKAAARSTCLEAVAFFEQALKALDCLPETEQSLGAGIDIRVDLGTALMAIMGFHAPEVNAVYRTALQLCDRLGETHRLFPVLWGIWIHRMHRGEMRAARALGERLLTVARHEKDPALLLQAHHALWSTLFQLGDLVAVKAHAEQGLALYDPQMHRSHASRYGGHDPGVCARNHWGRALWLLGYPDQAVACVDHGLTLAQESSHAFTLAQTLGMAAWVHYQRGERQVAAEKAAASLTLATDQGFTELGTFASVLLGKLIVDEGHPKEGIGRIEAGWASQVTTGGTTRRLLICALIADAYGRNGQNEKALGVLAEGLALADENVELYFAPEVHRLRGELLLSQRASDSQEAETIFRRAIDIARSQQARSLELRAAMSLARLLARQGRRGDAHRMLDEIYGWFTEGFDTKDLKDAKALLEELSTA